MWKRCEFRKSFSLKKKNFIYNVYNYVRGFSKRELQKYRRDITYVSHWFFLIKFQYAVGFFSFLLLLICNKGTAGFRASLVPVHAAFGILTFVLGVAACLTGLTEKALFTIGYVSIFLRRKLRFILAVEEVFFCRHVPIFLSNQN